VRRLMGRYYTGKEYLCERGDERFRGGLLMSGQLRDSIQGTH